MKLRQHILAVLDAGPAYGLEIIDRLALRNVIVGGAVYPALRRLELEGFLESYETPDETGERGGRPRRVYRLSRTTPTTPSRKAP